MKTLPIRWKFAAWMAGLTTFILVVYSGSTLVNFYQEQIEAVDLEITAEGHRLMGIKEPARIEEAAREDESYADWLAHAVFDESGRLRFRSDRLTERAARLALVNELPHTIRDGKERWRTAVFTDSESAIVVAYNLREVWDVLADLVFAYVLSMPVAIAIVALSGIWISGRALRPLGDLTNAVERIRAEHLDDRVEVPVAKDELQRLTLVFNAMLGRLQRSFEQARRFAADASHELRTPLTILRGEVESLMRAPGITPDHQRKLVSVQEEIARQHHITDNLLLLARFDTGAAQIPMQELEFSSLVAEACDDVEALAEGRQVRIERKLAETVLVVGDQSHIRRVVLNLLDNAIKFNTRGGVVRCSLVAGKDKAIFRIGNTGPGIQPEMRSRLFERFFRADPSRSDARPGHGLGLSLSREIARAHGGDLEVEESTAADWTEFMLSLPLMSKTRDSALS
ncbi:MAG: HAMP domain-containing protein [Opitutaceae bacterium]|nr:HAMP domain-containing protein [Opitutaceae bacterium]